MEYPVRVERGRGGGGRRGGRGRGRGRGRGTRGPGERQPERGWRGPRGRARSRGRDGELPEQQEEQDEDAVGVKEDYDQPNEFSRRQIVSNWDRYKTEEKELDDSSESLRGTDFNVLLSSAGDSFAQFRFAEEKEWEVEGTSSKQLSPMFVDCQSLAQSLQELPLHLRLNVDAELVQITVPSELPQVRLKGLQDGPSKFRAPAATPLGAVNAMPRNAVAEDSAQTTFNVILNPATQIPKSAPSASQQAPDKLDEELDILLQLGTPASKSNDDFLNKAQNAEVLCDATSVTTSTDSPGAEVVDNTNSQLTEMAKKPDPEEELEDWLDSMIS
ncbi:cell death regulator Aven [Hemiscyllium ocellatum]|uniref:cell death regulator Aven n=1 Tax=Hemiscyllium ocellatum TaxID=170820 RepID=UPI0029668578|nr:cell death regulator Aven [Hemiscyllium ocellatum]